VALLFLAFFLVLPLIVVFAEAFREGVRLYFSAISEPEALAAIKLTLLTAAICVPLNTAFGLAAAWPPRAPHGGRSSLRSRSPAGCSQRERRQKVS